VALSFSAVPGLIGLPHRKQKLASAGSGVPQLSQDMGTPSASISRWRPHVFTASRTGRKKPTDGRNAGQTFFRLFAYPLWFDPRSP
jgi:hypothetical protein